MRVPANYWMRAASIGSSIYANRSLKNVDEQAGPAYFEGLAISRWLFWRRLKLAVSDIPQSNGQKAVDFGCGFGLLLPWLRENFEETIAVDIVPELAQAFIEQWDAGLANQRRSIRFHTTLVDAKIADSSVDLILAFDVLEHFALLDETLIEFRRILSPSGAIVVTGPTENLLYRMGRRLVGFSGDYHRQDVYQVQTKLVEYFDVRVAHVIPRLAPLFLVLVCTRRE
ncbi:MAG: class I SAM-dependent methyltransferase [Pirellula sp.]